MDEENEKSAQNSDDTDYETDEEALVHVTISGTLQEDLSNIKSNEFSFIDINTEKPLVVIGNQVFTGQFQEAVGTSVFFQQADNSQHQDKVFSRHCARTVDYFNLTRKKLVLKRVFLNKKSGSTQEADDTDQAGKGNNQDSEDKTQTEN